MNLLGISQMFERSAILSALIVLIVFGVSSYKYCLFIESKNSQSIVQK